MRYVLLQQFRRNILPTSYTPQTEAEVSYERFINAYITQESDGCVTYRGADKSLARPGRKQATATEDFDFHISYL